MQKNGATTTATAASASWPVLPIWKPSKGDNGRGMAADVDLSSRGAEYWSAADYNVYNNEGSVLSTGKRPAYCFRIYWDGTATDNLLDGVNITAYNNGSNNRIYSAPAGSIKNGTKAYPVLSGDLFGDWREEVIWCSSADSCTLNICSSTTDTKLRTATLLHDHLYRLSTVWQNVGYNQPPHLSYFLPDSVGSRFIFADRSLQQQAVEQGTAIAPVEGRMLRCTSLTAYRTLLNGNTEKFYGVPAGFTFSYDKENMAFRLEGMPEKTGLYQVILRTSGNPIGTELTDTISINISEPTAITSLPADTETSSTWYNLQGMRVSQPQKGGIYIRNGRQAKIIRRRAW